MSDSNLKLGELQEQIDMLKKDAAEREMKRAVKLKQQELEHKLKKQNHLQQEQKLALILEQRLAEKKELAQKLRHKHAKADLDSARAEHARIEREEKKVQQMQHQIAERLAKLKSNNHATRKLQVMDMPKMIDDPDWEGISNWQPYLSVQQQTYKLQSGKLSQPKKAWIRIRLSVDPFQAGGFRYVYYAKTDDGQRYVAKRLYGESNELASNVQDVEADIQDHLISEKCIADFHRRANGKHASTAPMRFTDAASLIVANKQDFPATGGRVVYFLEPYVEGKYCKWIQNTGEISSHPSVPGGDVVDTAQAMVHFSYEMSLKKGRNRRYMITDIQGFKLGDGSITLIDPAICRPRVAGVRAAGADYGIQAAASCFFHTHKCSHICHALNLPQRGN